MCSCGCGLPGIVPHLTLFISLTFHFIFFFVFLNCGSAWVQQISGVALQAHLLVVPSSSQISVENPSFSAGSLRGCSAFV